METCAIIARTNRALRPFEEALSRENIKYHVIGGSSYWQAPEIRAAVAWVGLALYPSDHLLAAAIRSPFHPTKYLPKQKMLPRLKELKTEEQGYWHFLVKEPHQVVESRNLSSVQEFVQFVHGLQRYRSLRPGDATKRILESLRAFDHYSQDEMTPDSDPVANLNELCSVASRFDTIKEFLDHTRKATAASKSRKGVALSTAHAAKGLEFQRVYVVSCNDGVMPHSKSTDPQEEANIFFVACSRAERELILTYAGNPSPFLKVVREMDEVPA